MGPYRISVFLAVLAVTCAVDFGPILPTPLPQDTHTATNTQKYERTVPTTAKDEKTEVKTTIPILSVSQKDVTTVSSTIESTSKQPRAMNLTLPASLANSIQNSTSSESKKSPKMASDLSDVSMDDDMDLDYLPRSVGDDNSTLFGEARVVNRPGIRSNERTLVPLEAPFVASAKDVIDSSCVDSGKIYKMGEKVLRDCDEVCTCERGGKLVCQPRCSGPFFRRGRKVDDPLCSEKFVEEDSCCSILVCSADTKSDGCTYGNTTYAIGESFHQGCERRCECNPGGNVTCKARCPVLEQRDDCVNVADDKDHCCMVQLCDVTTDDDDHVMPANIRDAKHDKTVTNSTNSAEEENFGKDKSKNATIVAPSPKAYNISKNITKESINAVPTIKEVTARQNESTTVQPKAEQCTYNGKFYDAGEEFHVGCQKLCLCLDYGQVMCHTLVCPSDQGLDVIDPFCVSWGPDPPDFKPHYPMCCPPTMRCISNGSCEYKGHMLPNWSNIPEELSGCEQRCYCDTGVVECGPVCPPLPAAPPSNLNCQPPHFPKVMLRKGETCCKEWTCVPSGDRNSTSNKTDKDKNRPKDHYKNNETDKNNLLAPPLFVTLPPDINKAIHETFGLSPEVDNKKSKPKYEDHNPMGPYFVPHSPQSQKPEKIDGTKHYEYPGPFADPNHKPQPPQNGLGSFPFIKKHKDKQIYPYETGNPHDFVQYENPNPNKAKDNPRKFSNANTPEKKPQHASDHEDYPVNDPYLSSNPLHVPFNQNGVGPGYFNPAATKNQQDLLNILHQQGNTNPNSINPALIHQNNPGVYNGNQDTIHVYTDGSPIHIEHLLQHIQQADSNQNHFNPYGNQSQRPNPLNRQPEEGVNSSNHVPPAFPGLGGFPNSIPGGPAQDGVKNGEGALQILVLEASSPTSLRLIFSIPSVMVGLHGRVQLRYTDSNNPDPSSWRLQEFAPPDDLLATSQLEFSLGSLRPDTLYRIQAAVTLRQLQDVPRSFIHSVRTPPLQEETTMPPVIAIEPNLAVGQVLATSAQVTWRPFTQDELLYIDGIQLRYREIDGKVFSGTPLIHRAVTSFQLEGLKPNTSYEVGIYFIPFLGQHTELQSANMVRLNTPLLTDMYDWNVVLEVDDITAWSLSLHWTGVPRPAERYVHIYRAVWRAEAARADKSNFSLPARDALPWVNVTGLTPGTRYKIWLELYLTNGKIKTSNVKDVMTKPGKPAPQEAITQEGKLLESSVQHRGDYYSSLVAVAVLAVLGIMTSLVLLLVLLRRHRAASAPICSPAVGSARSTPALPPYDSPTYKLDLQQETMDL